MNRANAHAGQVPGPAVSLRRSLQLRVGLLVASAVLLVGLGGITFGLTPMIGKISRTQFSSASTDLAASLDKVFAPAEQILAMSHGWINDTAPDLEQPDTFNQLFQPILETLPQTTSVVAGTSKGQGWLLLQRPDGSWLNRMTDLNRWGAQHHFFVQAQDGVKQEYWESLNYDPRQRSWYTAAMNNKHGVQWTAPYQFFTTGDPGITASTYMKLSDGRDFVLGLDLMLRDLSLTTMNAKIGRNGMALVLTEDFRVLALPAAPAAVNRSEWLTRILRPGAELGVAPLTHVLANWTDEIGDEVTSFRSNETTWLVHIQPYHIGEQILWLVALAPESDFAPNWLSVAGLLFAGLVVMLLLAAAFARQQAGRIAQPLEALAEASTRIGQLDFRAPPVVTTQISEVVQLARAQEQMRSLLLENQRQLEVQEAELRDQIAALRSAENKIMESEAYNQLLFNDSLMPMSVLDPLTGRFVDCNPAAARAYQLTDRQAVVGLTPADVSATVQYDGTPSGALAEMKIRDALTSGAILFDWRNRRPDGSEWDSEVHLMPFRYGDRVLLQFNLHDVTERRQAEKNLQLAANVFTHAREGILITGVDGNIIDVNESFSRITLFRRDEVIGKNPRMLASGRHEQGFYAAMWQDLVEKGHWYGEVWDKRKNGEIYAAMLTISAVRDHRGTIQQYVALFSDITSLKTHQKQLEHIAHFDPLTTLPNRVLLADRLHQAMAQEPRRGQLLAVAYLDLDGFKSVNDHHGHEVGDQLLIALSSRMKTALREGDTLARLGGDEFVVVLLDLKDAAACVPMLTRLLAAAAQPTAIGELTLKVSASLGVTFYPQADEVDADQLMRQADQAMYQAKQTGKNRYHIFDAEQDRSVRGHHETIVHIRHALAADEFVLYYQPKVNMRSGRVIGAEALIRWQHPERGLLSPAVFLPVIEDHPLSVELGEWVINAALTQIESWQADGMHLPVSINVGARQLQQLDFVERLRRQLAAHPKVAPADLSMEVLETSALEDLDRVAQVIEACQEIGIQFALDDFGTGYSSLTYLKRLAASQLKIDQSFVRDMLDDPDDLSILGGVLSLATAFRRQVIAEGVETIEHGAMLLQLGCELAQGYGIARPMPASEMPAWKENWQPDATWRQLHPVNQTDFALLFARVEHRAWIAAIEQFLRGERENLPLVHHNCRFNDWLQRDGLENHREQPEFKAIGPVHVAMHALATQVCSIAVDQNAEEALARLGELYALLEIFLQHLDALTRAGRVA